MSLYRFFVATSIATLTALSLGAVAAPEPTVQRGLYQVRTQTGMPNMDENLRYAVVTKNRCLSRTELSTAFWMLSEVSLQDCTLTEDSNVRDGGLHYTLRCTGGYGTSGNAHWQVGEKTLTGMMNVRLGGKNMTFYQRIVATRIGPCP